MTSSEFRPRILERDWETLTRDELYRLLSLRCAVFVVEQQCAFQEPDGLDPQCVHLLACVDEGTLVGCARVVPPGLSGPQPAIGRIVVAPPWRRSGLGSRLVRTGLSLCARRWPGTPVRLHAQTHLTGYYERLGFAATDERWVEDGIPHVAMLHSR